MSQAVASLPKDVGLCGQCSARNSRSATRCHACSTVLPWVKVKAEKSAPAAPFATSTGGVAVAAPKFKAPAINVNAGEALAGFAGHGATFLFCAAAPLLGYFLWKHMNN